MKANDRVAFVEHHFTLRLLLTESLLDVFISRNNWKPIFTNLSSVVSIEVISTVLDFQDLQEDFCLEMFSLAIFFGCSTSMVCPCAACLVTTGLSAWPSFQEN